MTAPRTSEMFAALRIPNYRRYFTGQAVSLVGTWMQTVALGWLVFTLSGSGTALGAVMAVQFFPMLVLGPYGGLLADRLDKRRLLVGTQVGLATISVALGIITIAGVVQVWMVIALALGLGLLVAVDTPARQAFVLEMVGPDHLRNAVSLNSVLMNAARAVGPALAAVLIATTGTGLAFIINAGTFAATIWALCSMTPADLHRAAPAPRESGQVRAGLAYVGRTTELLVPLMMLAIVGMLTYEFSVVLPLLAEGPLDGGAGTYGLLTSAMGVGAIAGGLAVAGAGRTGLRPMSVAAAVFGVAVLLAALAPNLPLALAALALVGATSVLFLSTGNSTLQLRSAPSMRGRVMALWAVAFVGTTPIGAPIIGIISEHVGPRGGLVTGAVACLAAAAIGIAAARHIDRDGPGGDPEPVGFSRRASAGDGPRGLPAPRPT